MPDREIDSPMPTVRNQAAHWVTSLNSGEWTDEDQRRLDVWIAQDARHRFEFERARIAWERIGRFPAGAIPQMKAARCSKAPLRMLPIAASFAVLFIAGIVAALWFSAGQDKAVLYSTARGEQLSVALADGSTMQLNTDTVVMVEYGWRMRTIRLERGEALFTVAPGDERPFQVMAAGGEIRDLGTRFSVSRSSDEVAVLVLEGAVTVKTAQSAFRQPLGAGERIGFGPSGRLLPVERVDAEAVTAWTRGRMVFDNVTLIEMARQVARYHDVRIVVDDPASASLRVSGTFKTNDLDGLIDTLETILPLKADRSIAGLIRLYPRS